MAEMFEESFWENRYRTHEVLWSGRPNPTLVEEAQGLAPGTAIDVGCGEGADAVWLAGCGWRVTALDFSATAIARGVAAAAERGITGIDWVQGDARTVEPTEGGYDLVSAQFVHLPTGQFRVLVDRLAAAVAPGGSLIVAGHHPDDLKTTLHRPPHPDLYVTAEELAGWLDPAEWTVDTAAARHADRKDDEGRSVTITFAVLRAHRT